MPDFSKSISVIIPAYNIEDLLEKCVDSVAAQDYPQRDYSGVQDELNDTLAREIDEMKRQEAMQ